MEIEKTLFGGLSCINLGCDKINVYLLYYTSMGCFCFIVPAVLQNYLFSISTYFLSMRLSKSSVNQTPPSFIDNRLYCCIENAALMLRVLQIISVLPTHCNQSCCMKRNLCTSSWHQRLLTVDFEYQYEWWNTPTLTITHWFGYCLITICHLFQSLTLVLFQGVIILLLGFSLAIIECFVKMCLTLLTCLFHLELWLFYYYFTVQY